MDGTPIIASIKAKLLLQQQQQHGSTTGKEGTGTGTMRTLDKVLTSRVDRWTQDIGKGGHGIHSLDNNKTFLVQNSSSISSTDSNINSESDSQDNKKGTQRNNMYSAGERPFSKYPPQNEDEPNVTNLGYQTQPNEPTEVVQNAEQDEAGVQRPDARPTTSEPSEARTDGQTASRPSDRTRTDLWTV